MTKINTTKEVTITFFCDGEKAILLALVIEEEFSTLEVLFSFVLMDSLKFVKDLLSVDLDSVDFSLLVAEDRLDD